jgi:hypothetical protein
LATLYLHDALPIYVQHEYTLEVCPGRPIVCRQLSLVSELAAGKLPSEFEKFVLFEPFDGEEYKLVKGEVKRKTDVELSVDQAERWQNYLRAAARAMIRPRLRLKGEPNYANGEIGPDDLTYAEVREVAFVAIRKVVPPLPAMFRDTDTGERAGLGTGADLPVGADQPHQSEPDDRIDGA